MKKILMLMLVLTLLLGGAAFAEENENAGQAAGEKAFSGIWMCDRATALIFQEDGGYIVHIEWANDAKTSMMWDYGCFYYAETNTLRSTPLGILSSVVYGDNGSVSATDLYDDGMAVFAIDADGFLIWNDQTADAGKGMKFKKIGNNRFEGTWICDRAAIEICRENEGYKVSIEWGSSAWDNTVWQYSCLYHGDDDTLVSMPFGLRTEFHYADDDTVTSRDVYDDGSAVFSIDAEGYLHWLDEKEDAGKDMRFERAGEENDEEDG